MADYNVSLDVGKNFTGLVQKLATQIGVTADKVFPWYVKQAYIEGITNLSAIIVIFSVALLLIFIGGFKSEFSPDTKDQETFFFMFVVGCIVTVMISIPCIVGGWLSTSITQFMNPEYFAMKMITTDIGKLVGK